MSEIEAWFDRLYEKAQPITEADLKAAEQARAKRPPWGGEPKRELVDIPIDQLKELKLAVMLWSVPTTPQEDRKISKLFPNAPPSVRWWLDTPEHVRHYPWGTRNAGFPDKSR